MDVRSESLLCGLVEGIVSTDELLELGLNGGNLLLWKVVFGDGDVGFLEVTEETDFVGLEEEEGLSVTVHTTGGTPDSVDVVSWIIWRIELDNPINFWNLERRPVSNLHNRKRERERNLHPNHEQQHQYKPIQLDQHF